MGRPTMYQDRVKTNLAISREDLQKLKEIALQEQKSSNEIISQLVHEYVEERSEN